jgi:phosphatidylglycerophosphatase A
MNISPKTFLAKISACTPFARPKPTTRLPSKMWLLKHPQFWLAYGLGTGLIPFAPGTWGSIIAIPLFYTLEQSMSEFYYPFFLLCFTLHAVMISRKASEILQVHDHPAVNIDEMVAIAWMLWALPPTFAAIWKGLLLFRMFDILKPWPINWLDNNIHGGWGMIIDDLAAVAFTILLMQVLI